MRFHKKNCREQIFSHPCAANPCWRLDICIDFYGKMHCIFYSSCKHCFRFWKVHANACHTPCLVFQMPPSSAIVQKMLGYKCIVPGCGKIFDSRKGYNTHCNRPIYEGTACADIRNGRQLFSRGAESGDRPKVFSISIAPHHGANHDAGDAACPNDLRNTLRNRVIFIA